MIRIQIVKKTNLYIQCFYFHDDFKTLYRINKYCRLSPINILIKYQSNETDNSISQ